MAKAMDRETIEAKLKEVREQEVRHREALLRVHGALIVLENLLREMDQEEPAPIEEVEA